MSELKDTQIIIRVSKDLRARLRVAAAQNRLKMSSFAYNAIEDAVIEHEKKWAYKEAT